MTHLLRRQPEEVPGALRPHRELRPLRGWVRHHEGCPDRQAPDVPHRGRLVPLQPGHQPSPGELRPHTQHDFLPHLRRAGRMWKHRPPIPAPGPTEKTHRPRPGPGHSRTELPLGTLIPGRALEALLRERHAIFRDLHPTAPGLSHTSARGRVQTSTPPRAHRRTLPNKTSEIICGLIVGQRRIATLGTAPHHLSVALQPNPSHPEACKIHPGADPNFARSHARG